MGISTKEWVRGGDDVTGLGGRYGRRFWRGRRGEIL